MSTLLATPALDVNTLTPRPYQLEAIEAVRREFAAGARRALVVLPTGTGKTVVFASTARLTAERGGRTLVLAHRKELVRQAADMMERVGLAAGVEQAEEFARSAYDPHVVVANTYTLKPKRLASWPRDYFRLIVVDEAHHATADSYRRILDHFEAARAMGVTATPDRADDDKITDVFPSLAYEMSLWDAMTAGPPGPYLCRLKVVRCETEIDLRGLRTTGDDFSDADLEERIKPLAETLANAMREKIGDRQAIVFTPDCGSASAIATALRSLGLEADFVWGDSPDRDAKVRRYRDGATRVLVNCQLFTEGFDAPATSAIVLCRPTKSRGLYSQMIGRGTRLSPGKADCLVVDFAWLTDSLDLVRPADLFDRSDRTDEEAEILDKMMAWPDDGQVVDVVEAAKRAKEEATRRQVVRVQARERKAGVRWVTYDPLAMADTLGVVFRGSANATHDPATPGQVAALSKFGVVEAEKLSRRRASKLLDVMIERRRKDLATPKQVAWLIRNDVPPDEARSMSFGAARARLDELFGSRR